MKIVKPHKLISRDVLPSDYDRVIKCIGPMVKLCYERHGNYPGGIAVAHAQVDDKDPLRFFVTREGEVVVNPIVSRHVRHTSTKYEGCLSYPDGPMTNVERWHKCDVTFLTATEGTAFHEKSEELSGLRAEMFQHEIDHMDGFYIYDNRLKQ